MLKGKNTGLFNKSVGWALTSVILMLALIPVHLHLHHAEDVSALTHEAHLHVLTGTTDLSHHDDVHILKALPDVMAKKFSDTSATLFLVVLLLVVLALVQERLVSWLRQASFSAYRLYYYLIPPLRAPPRH